MKTKKPTLTVDETFSCLCAVSANLAILRQEKVHHELERFRKENIKRFEKLEKKLDLIIMKPFRGLEVIK